MLTNTKLKKPQAYFVELDSTNMALVRRRELLVVCQGDGPVLYW